MAEPLSTSASGAEPFSQRPSSGARTSGLLMVDRGARTWKITADFPLEPGDSIADDLIPKLGGQRLLFKYTVPSEPIAMVMAEVQRAVGALKVTENKAFQSRGTAFSDERSLRLALHPLAAIGSDLFSALFGIGKGSPSGSDLYKYGHCLRRWLTAADDFMITSPRNFLPWNLVYSGREVPLVPCEVEPRGFWAFGKRLYLGDHGTCILVPMPTDWKLAAGVESEAPEVALGHPLHVAADHPFEKHATRVVKERELDRLFKAFGDADILYFYGHAHGSANGAEYGSITLHDVTVNGLRLKRMLRDGQARVAKRRPLLVFLNGCLTSVGDRFDETIPGCLVKHRKNTFCFVSTISSVPAWAAAEFARSFFCSYIDAGGSLGDALSAAREEMLTRYRSPIGLFYAGSGNPATRLVRA